MVMSYIHIHRLAYIHTKRMQHDLIGLIIYTHAVYNAIYNYLGRPITLIRNEEKRSEQHQATIDMALVMRMCTGARCIQL